MKPKSSYDDILKDLKATVTSPLGTSLSESKLNAQMALLNSLTPYMTPIQEAEFKRKILEQMMGDGTGEFFKQEYPGKTFNPQTGKWEDEPQGRSLEEFLETLK